MYSLKNTPCLIKYQITFALFINCGLKIVRNKAHAHNTILTNLQELKSFVHNKYAFLNTWI